jgi:hypothetical protein
LGGRNVLPRYIGEEHVSFLSGIDDFDNLIAVVVVDGDGGGGGDDENGRNGRNSEGNGRNGCKLGSRVDNGNIW